MNRAFSFLSKSLLLIAVLLTGFHVRSAMAGVETYVDEALPPTSGIAMGQPLHPGDLTMQDILNSSARNKKKTVAPVAATKTTSQAKTVTSSDTAGTLLLQGMQGALGEPVTAKTSAPSVNVAAADPKDGISAAALPDATPGKMAGPCSPQTTSWTKSCAEAGYPATYTGQIRGETRSSCPDGNLQDVWISNGCVPPEAYKSASAPLTSPSTASNSANPFAASPSGNTNTWRDASCGAANGLAVSAKPSYDLCISGKATAVSGEGPWNWNCEVDGGGISVSCAAPALPAATASMAADTTETPAAAKLEDANCGSANGTVVDHAPTTNLCAKGMASNVNGSGPWSWACSGINGGKAAACGAQKKIDGICGFANNSGADQMPTGDLCNSGYASAVTGTGPWSWTCGGLNGGSAASCSASQKMAAVCGSASLAGQNDAPKNNLCSVGDASAVNGNGPWNWTCGGMNGGSSVKCEARRSENGICGAAHGSSVASAPTTELCNSGQASHVTGNGPWNWSCAGTDDGNSASCTAMRETAPPSKPVAVAPVPAAKPTPTAVAPAPDAAPVSAVASVSDAAAVAETASNICGTAAELIAIEAPTKNLCKSGTAGTVSGKGPWSWTCSDHGKKSSCATLSLAPPGADARPTTTEATAPAPTAAPIAAVASAAYAPEATPPAEPSQATCGSIISQGSTTEPKTDLCSVGKPSIVSGKGPWTWSCKKGKSSVACSVAKIADGACGTANGSVQKFAPTTGLCNAGAATQIQGAGPWVWTCVGTGGGSSISCSATSQAQTRVDGSCGVATHSSSAAIPSTNLCDSGVASSVYGQGPWTWTCSGLNGGIAASCSAQKNAPPAPPPPGPSVNGLCGSNNGVAMDAKPADGLCSTGTATAISGEGPWNWACIGQNGGMTVSCTAPLQPPAPISGVCGAANGIPTLIIPKSGLCSGGISSAVSGKGPWTWSCSGVNGGSAVGCVAPLAGTDVGSLPSMTTTPDAAPSPVSAPTPLVAQKLVTPRLPSKPMPSVKTPNLPPAPSQQDMFAPATAPSLPSDIQGVTPPPIRESIQPTPALRTDESSNILPGNHFVMPEDITTIPFVRGSDNYDITVLPTLIKLADVLAQNGGVRVTLTAYADNSGTTPREARRLSLSRALTIRDFLTTKGISSSRIDVRALGANVASGEPDRVDVKAN